MGKKTTWWNKVVGFFKEIKRKYGRPNYNYHEKFTALTPTSLSDLEIAAYEESLDFSLNIKNRDITNIAVTGNYGAGKSSVISTYLNRKYNTRIKNRLDEKVITVSLATFSLRGGSESDETNEQKIQNIEFSVLQQLTHKTHPNQLPDSRFERIIVKPKKTLFLKVFGALTTILAFPIFLMLWFKWEPLIARFGKIESSWTLPFFVFTLGIGCLFLVTTYVIKSGLFNKQDIQSLDLLKGNVVFKNKRDQSVLSLFLDEILYFFEKTKFDVVVFEDLDRLEHREIFIRLREINQIINSSNQVSRTIKFVYAVKDDLFLDQESRVKFFDFIIPIIPVMDFENSYDHLRAEITRVGGARLFDVLNEGHLLRDVSLYIRDKRLLNNILNEYYIYLMKDGKDIDYQATERLKKIFALVVYKNFMPEDFGKIKEKKSILCKIVAEYRKKFLYEELKEKWEESILEKQKELRELESLKNKSIDDIKIEIVDSLLFPGSNKNNVKFRENYQYSSFGRGQKISFFDSHIIRDADLTSRNFLISDAQYSSPKCDSELINEYLDDFANKSKRISLIEKGKDKKLRAEIKVLQAKIDKHYSLANTISLYVAEIDLEDQWEQKFYCLKDINIENDGTKDEAEAEGTNRKNTDLYSYTEKPIIFMLIRRGYIDQSYINYLSLSKGNAEELITFRRALADDHPYRLVFDIELDDRTLESFLKKDESVFSDYTASESILNFSLILYLLKSSDPKNKEYLQSIIDFHFQRESRFHLEFLKHFISKLLVRQYEEISQESEVEDLEGKKERNIQFVEDAHAFVKLIFENNENAFNNFLLAIPNEEFEDISEELKNILLLILISVEDDLLDLSTENISTYSSLLQEINDLVNQFNRIVVDRDIRFMRSWFERLKIKIKLTQPFSEDEISQELFQNLVDISAYEITKDNIIEIFKFFKKPEDQLLDQNYTAIITNFGSNSNFIKYIEANISQYVNDILLKQKLGVMESNEAMIALINNKLLSNDQRMGLIKQHESICFGNDFDQIEFEDILCRVENDSSFSQDLFDLDIRRRKEGKSLINATWDNAYWGIYSNETITKELQNEWLIIVCNEIVKSDLPADKERLDSLKKLITFNNALDFKTYSALMKHLKTVLESEADLEKMSQLSWDKIKFLMEKDFIAVSPSAIQTIYDNHIKEEDDE